MLCSWRYNFGGVLKWCWLPNFQDYTYFPFPHRQLLTLYPSVIRCRNLQKLTMQNNYSTIYHFFMCKSKRLESPPCFISCLTQFTFNLQQSQRIQHHETKFAEPNSRSSFFILFLLSVRIIHARWFWVSYKQSVTFQSFSSTFSFLYFPLKGEKKEKIINYCRKVCSEFIVCSIIL